MPDVTDEMVELLDITDELRLSSTYSTMVSLAGIRIGRYGLDAHRQALLERVPTQGTWARVKHMSLTMMDLAYLTARTGDEFAILRSKHEDIIFHGTRNCCRFLDELEAGLRNHKYELICHSHPGEDEPDPSNDDRLLLRRIGQRSSYVISGRTGRVTEYTENPFE